jgi:hypothetical protein
MNWRFPLLVLSAILNISSALAGGDSIGHGGVIWACIANQGTREVLAGRLTDTYEAEKQYQGVLIPDPGGNPFVIYESRKAWLKRELPELYLSLKSRFEYVEQHRIFVDAELLPTNDYNNAIKPEAGTCPLGEWRAINIANFREDDQRILIRESLWKSSKISSLDKAALLFHEAIYYWTRSAFGTVNSDKARRITGLLFTLRPTSEIKDEIRKILGADPHRPDAKIICIMKNVSRNQIYVAFDRDMDSAVIAVRMRCQDDVEPVGCDVNSVECEEIVAGSQHQYQCLAENRVSRRFYIGRGRNVLEAQFNAHMSCYIGSPAVGASAHHCPELSLMQCK